MEQREVVLPKRPGPARHHSDPELQAFSELVSFFRAELVRPDFLQQVACGDRVRADVASRLRNTFAEPLDWFRRLRPLLRLPAGSTVLEWGGGYGLDAVFLASRGYSSVYFDLTLGRIAVAEHFAWRWREEREAMDFDFRSIVRDQAGFEPFGRIDAVVLDQVAHHVEPVEGVFAKCSMILAPGGRLFLLEPNAWNPITHARLLRKRGLRTTVWAVDDVTGERHLRGNDHIRFPAVWNRIAQRCGFELESQEHLAASGAPFRDVLETTRGVRALTATQVVSVYRRRR